MKWSIPALGLMFVGGVMVGFAANPTQPLRAADHLSVYSVYEANVIDPEGYKSNKSGCAETGEARHQIPGPRRCA
jgi:hypothetical protein